MIKKTSKRNRGGGFTLVELLVVLLIVVILAGLISAAAYRGIKRAKIARITVDIQQLAMALEKYQQQFGEYPPDFSDQTANGQLLVLRHINKAFPRIHGSVHQWGKFSVKLGQSAARSWPIQKTHPANL